MRANCIFICTTCLLAAAMLASCTDKAPENGALIQGQVTGLDPGKTAIAVLFQHEGGVGRGIQTDTLNNGRFTFRLDSLAEADHYMVSLFYLGENYTDVINYGPEIYLEPGVSVRIKGEGKHFRTARIDSPVKDQKLRQNYLKKMSLDDWNTMDEIMAHRNHVVYEIYYNESLTQEQRDSLRALAQKELDESHEFSDRLSQQDLKILQTEEIGAYALHRINTLAKGVSYLGEKENREAILQLYERLSDEQKATRDGMEAINHLKPVKTLSIGSSVPSYRYVDKEGKAVQLSNYKGKWILVDFWSSGCMPCIESVPELAELSKEFQQTLAVISINLDKENTWRKASKEHGISWNDWNDPKGTAGSVRTYGTIGIPTFVIVSPEGIIIDIITGYGEGQLRSAIQYAMNSASD